MPADMRREKQFLIALVKCIVVLAVAVGAAYLLHPLLPSWLVQVVGLTIGVLGIGWALRGTSFDVTRRK